MRQIFTIFAILATATAAFAQETAVKSTVQSVGLFKNGVVVVQEEISVPGGGRYMLEQVPVPIHGTFFLESDAVVETTVTQRNITEPLDEGQVVDFQKDLAGRKVRVYLSGDKTEPVEGTVTAIPEADPNRMIGRSRAYSRSGYSEYADYAAMPSISHDAFRPVISSDRSLTLDTAAGQTFLTGEGIYRVDVEKKIETVQRKRNVMLFDVKAEKPAKIRLFYLTKGIAWAPSYRIDISDPKRLVVEQTAVVVNELRELKDTNVSLISGFPKIECENVDAPFSPSSSLSAFFQQLAARGRGSRNPVMTQQAIAYNSPTTFGSDDGSSAVTVSGEGPDIHFLPIGKRSMSIGDSLSLSTGKATAEYERIVEWTIPDRRDVWGRYSNRDENQQETDPWDMLRFRNPLKFPMTTAPATIIANNQFYGQNTSYWAGPGEMTKLPITKSMSVRVKAVEFERGGDQAQRVVVPAFSEAEPMPVGNQANAAPTKSKQASLSYVRRDGDTYREAIIDVELTIVNRRAEPVKMIVNRRFSGELENPIDGATVRLLNEDLRGVNRKHEAQWEFDLPSGQTKTLKYAYVVLIRT